MQESEPEELKLTDFTCELQSLKRRIDQLEYDNAVLRETNKRQSDELTLSRLPIAAAVSSALFVSEHNNVNLFSSTIVDSVD